MPWFSVKTRRRIWGITIAKRSYWENKKKKNQKEHLKREVDQAKRGTSSGMMRYGVFQDRKSTYSSRWRCTDILIDTCKFHNNRFYWTCVCSNQIYVCFANKGPSSQGYDFSSGHVWMWELDCEESWAPKNWCFWTVVLEKTLESPLVCKEIQPDHSKGDQSWVFIGGTDAEAETPILWPPHAKSSLIGKDSDAGRDWGQEEKGTTEAEMAGWTWVWVNSRSWW